MISFEFNGVSFGLVSAGRGVMEEKIDMHAHSSNSFELHFITNGRGTLVTKDNEYRLKKGDFFITGPNIYHAQTTDKETPVEDIYIYLQKIGGTPNVLSAAFLDTHFYFAHGFDYRLADEVVSELRERKLDYKTAVSALLLKQLTELVRAYLPDGIYQNTEDENLYDRRFLIIERSFLYSPDITLTQLSENIGLCTRQTERLLKKYYGKTFRELRHEKNISD